MENYTFTGIIGDDATAVKTKNSIAINFDVAINKSYKNKETNEYVKVTKWVHCTKWAQSEAAVLLLKKGLVVLVDGEPTSKHYVDSNGEVKDTISVNVQRFEVFERRATQTEEVENENN